MRTKGKKERDRRSCPHFLVVHGVIGISLLFLRFKNKTFFLRCHFCFAFIYVFSQAQVKQLTTVQPFFSLLD